MITRSGLLAICAALGGCAGGVSGIGGTSELSCAAPPGVSCMSVTGISINANKNNLPALRARPEDGQPNADAAVKPSDGAASAAVSYNLASADAGKLSPKAMDAPYSGSPIRTPARVLRIWMAPYEDTEYDLHDQRYMYVTIHTGRWVLEANQLNVQAQFKQVYPLGKRDEAADDSSKSAAPLVDTNGDTMAGGPGTAARKP